MKKATLIAFIGLASVLLIDKIIGFYFLKLYNEQKEITVLELNSLAVKKFIYIDIINILILILFFFVLKGLTHINNFKRCILCILIFVFILSINRLHLI